MNDVQKYLECRFLEQCTVIEINEILRQIHTKNQTLERKLENMRGTLVEIHNKSRNGYHGRGYTLGTIALKAKEDDEEVVVQSDE